MCQGLGENARAPGRGRHHQGRVAGGPDDFQEVSPGDLPAGCGARCRRGSARLPHRWSTAAGSGPHPGDRLRRLLPVPGIRRGDRQEDTTGSTTPGLRSVLDDLMEAAPFVPSVLVAALISLSMTTIATGLLVIPGVWLYTRWSLTTPVIREESIGPLAATRRSNELVRGRFWFVFMTATVAYYFEGVVIHEGALVAGSVTGSHAWGAWAGGSIAATLVVPLAAFVTSLAHFSVASRT